MSDECPFGHGVCVYGIEKYSTAVQSRSIVEELIKFRMAYCTPCLESLKLYELRDIKQELSWIREAQEK